MINEPSGPYLKRVNQFRQNTVEGHFNAAPIRNRRRTERMILVFSKGIIQRAGEDFNQSEFLVPRLHPTRGRAGHPLLAHFATS